MISLRSFAVTVGAIGALTGCATPPPQPLTPARSAAAIEQRSLVDPELVSFLAASGLPPAGKWDLDRLTLAALYFHPDMAIANAQLAVARAGVRTARERPNPQTSFSLEHASPAELVSPWTVGAAIGLVLELFHKRGDRVEQATDLERAARHDIAASAWRLRGGVRTALLDIHFAIAQLDYARQQLAVETELARMLGDRVRLGAASSIDMAQAESARQQAALAVAQAQQRLAAGRAKLAVAVGVPLSAFDGVTIDDSAFAAPPPPVDLARLRRTALTDRADIQASLARYDAADAAVRLELAKRFPDLTLGPSYSYDQGQNKIGLSAAAALPIFNRNGGPIDEAEAKRALAAAQFEALQTNVLGAIDTRRVGQLRKQLAAGQIARPILLAAQANLVSAEQARITAHEARETALGALEDAVQVPLVGGLDRLPALTAGAPRKDME
jgi:cobalt-zinc-cadmium efflux system outer membrane protein